MKYGTGPMRQKREQCLTCTRRMDPWVCPDALPGVRHGCRLSTGTPEQRFFKVKFRREKGGIVAVSRIYLQSKTSFLPANLKNDVDSEWFYSESEYDSIIHSGPDLSQLKKRDMYPRLQKGSSNHFYVKSSTNCTTKLPKLYDISITDT